jgi:hypothetical protein
MTERTKAVRDVSNAMKVAVGVMFVSMAGGDPADAVFALAFHMFGGMALIVFGLLSLTRWR